MKFLRCLSLILLLSQIATAYQVECEDPNKCPGYIAGLSNGGGVCSAFLVKKDIIATNLHCIPEGLRKGEMAEVNCNNRIRFFFPKTAKFLAQQVECDKVIYTSPQLKENELSTDFAFIKLAHEVQREVIEINQDGISDLSQIQIIKVDPEFPKGIVRSIDCEASQNTPVNPYFRDKYSPLVLMHGCPIMKGNSGSPLISSSGKAVGVLSAMQDVQFSFVNFDFMKKGTLRTALGTNFSCLNTFFLGYNIGYKNSCHVYIDLQSQKKMRDAIMDEVHREAFKKFQSESSLAFNEFAKSNSSLFLWQVKSRAPTDTEYSGGKLGFASLEPSCLLPQRAKPSTSLEVSVSIPNLAIQAGLNQKLKYQEVVVKDLIKVEYKILAQHLDFKQKIPIEVNVRGANNVTTSSRFNIEICKPNQ